MVCSGVRAPASLARESAIWPNTSRSCCAIPFVVSTRLGMRSLRRCSWFSTCAHCVLIASSCPTNLLYEHPDRAADTTIRIPATAVLRISVIATPSIVNVQPPVHHGVHHDAPPPPPPLPPPPKPPNPPPKPPPPPNPPPKPPPNGPTPLCHPLHGPAPHPRRRRRRVRPAIALITMNSRKIARMRSEERRVG